MRKRFLFSLLALIFQFSLSFAQSQEFIVLNVKYEIVSEDEKTCKVTGEKLGSNIIILNVPEEVELSGNTYKVIAIGREAFENCSGLTSIVLPQSVNSIDSWAFRGCPGLTSIELPQSLTSIGNGAFAECFGLTSIELPHSLNSIGEQAFNHCTGLTSIEFPQALTYIGYSAFGGCTGLTSIELPQSLTSIGSGAFGGCTGLTSIELPQSLNSIGTNAFAGCSGLTSIELPQSLTSIGVGAFSGCSGLTSIVLPQSLTSIGSGAFRDCSGLVTLDLPQSLTSIEIYTFWGCSGLTSIELPESLNSIGNMAFRDCSGLVTLDLPQSLNSIGSYAFEDCSGLTSIELPQSLTSIGDYAFSGCSGLTSIELPQSLNSLGRYAFSGCSGLTSIIYNTDNPISFSSQDIFSSETTDEATLYVPEDCFEAVKDLTPWNNFKNIQALPSLSISNEELSIWSGETSDLNVTVSPEEMPFGKVNVEWKSSDQSVAEIEGDGFNISINALKGGVVTIDCIFTWGDVWKQTLQCNVTVKETLKGLKIESDKDEILKGKSLIVSAIIDPSDAYYQDITWSSSDESIAQVLPSTNGHALVKALKAGKVTITAEAGSEEEGGFASATLDLLVIQLVESLSLDPTAITAEEGDTFQITAYVLPEDATDKTLEWSSSDESVATVDQTGLVSILKEGECVITAKTTDGSDLTANCYLSATSGINDIFFDTDETVDVYSLDGVKVRTNCIKNEALNLPTGVYLLRKGNKVKKLIIR